MSSTTTVAVAESSSAFEKFSLNAAASIPDVPVWEAPPVTAEDLEWADILTIDLSKLATEKEKLIKTVATALQRDGFFYVIGHDIAPETVTCCQICFERRSSHLLAPSAILDRPACVRCSLKRGERTTCRPNQGEGVFHWL